MSDSFWNALNDRIAQEDFTGAAELMCYWDGDGLHGPLQSTLAAVRVKRAHLEAQFLEVCEKRSRDAARQAYQRNL